MTAELDPRTDPARAEGVRVRTATEADAEAIRAIYNHEVQHSTATFDLVIRSAQEQRTWLASRSGAFSVLVAEWEGEVVGFASVSPYKERAAYRTTVEDSVYVRRDRHGRGIGTTLLSALLDAAEASGFHSVMARVEAGGVASPSAPRVLRIPGGRRRARGRAQVQPLARHRPDAMRPPRTPPIQDAVVRRAGGGVGAEAPPEPPPGERSGYAGRSPRE